MGEKGSPGTKVLITSTQASPSPCGTTATSLGLMLFPHWASLLTLSAGLENILVNLLLPDLHLCYTSVQVAKPSCSVPELSRVTYNCFSHYSGCSEGLCLNYGASGVCPSTHPQKGCAHRRRSWLGRAQGDANKSSSEISSQPHSLVHHTGPSSSTPPEAQVAKSGLQDGLSFTQPCQ